MQSHTCIACLSRMRNNIAISLRYYKNILSTWAHNRLIAETRGGGKSYKKTIESSAEVITSDFFIILATCRRDAALSLCVFLWNIFSVPSWRVRLRFTLFTPMYSTPLEHICNRRVIKE